MNLYSHSLHYSAQPQSFLLRDKNKPVHHKDKSFPALTCFRHTSSSGAQREGGGWHDFFKQPYSCSWSYLPKTLHPEIWTLYRSGIVSVWDRKGKNPTTSTVILLKKISLQCAAAFAHGLVLLNIHGFEKHTTEHTATHWGQDTHKDNKCSFHHTVFKHTV